MCIYQDLIMISLLLPIQVALKELINDVQEMKKNLDTVLDERDKQRDNFVIFRLVSLVIGLLRDSEY